MHVVFGSIFHGCISSQVQTFDQRRQGFAVFHCQLKIFRVFVVCMILFLTAVQAVITLLTAGFFCSAQNICSCIKSWSYQCGTVMWFYTRGKTASTNRAIFSSLPLMEGITPGRSRAPAGHSPINPSLTHRDTRTHFVLTGTLSPSGFRAIPTFSANSFQQTRCNIKL